MTKKLAILTLLFFFFFLSCFFSVITHPFVYAQTGHCGQQDSIHTIQCTDTEYCQEQVDCNILLTNLFSNKCYEVTTETPGFTAYKSSLFYAGNNLYCDNQSTYNRLHPAQQQPVGDQGAGAGTGGGPNLELPGGAVIINPLRDRFLTIGSLLSELLKFAFPIAGLILFAMLIMGGFGLLTSGGNEEAIKKAQGRITSAIIGFVIIFAAYWLIQILQTVLGLQPIFGNPIMERSKQITEPLSAPNRDVSP